jgi:P-type Cu+ transporter
VKVVGTRIDDLGRDSMPRVVSVIVLGGRTEKEFLSLAGSLAVDPSLGAAILDSSVGLEVEVRHVNVQAIAAEGVTGWLGDQIVTLGSSAFFAELGISLGDLEGWSERLAQQRQRIMFLTVDGKTAGSLGVMDFS